MLGLLRTCICHSVFALWQRKRFVKNKLSALSVNRVTDVRRETCAGHEPCARPAQLLSSGRWFVQSRILLCWSRVRFAVILILLVITHLR